MLFSIYFFFLVLSCSFFIFFFFNDTATTEIYTLSLHDALPIFRAASNSLLNWKKQPRTNLLPAPIPRDRCPRDRKSTRLNSSHGYISYAVFCLKKKKLQALLLIFRLSTGPKTNGHNRESPDLHA